MLQIAIIKSQGRSDLRSAHRSNKKSHAANYRLYRAAGGMDAPDAKRRLFRVATQGSARRGAAAVVSDGDRCSELRDGDLREAAEFSWLLTQGLLFSRRPPFIHVNQGFRFELKEPHELRGGSAKLSSALLHIKIKRAEAIQCLGKQIWEIVMSPSNADLLCAQPRTPERADTTTTAGFHVGSYLNRQFDSKAMNGHLLVGRLTALFSRLTANARGLMNQDHSRLHLVTMLTSWPAAPLTPDDAFSEQLRGRQVRRMNVGLHGVRTAQDLTAVAVDNRAAFAI
jgi:hypothetical protein